MSGYVARRFDPNARAGLRLTLLALGLLLVTVLVLPLAVLVRDSWEPLARLDISIEDSAHGAVIGNRWLLNAAKLLTQLGAPVLLELAAAGLVVFLLTRRRPRSAGYLFACVAGAYTLSTLGKVTVDRARPSFPDAVSFAHGASFPSGHATGSAAFYTALAVVLLSFVGVTWRRLLFAMALLVPITVAITRVLLGVHYPSDVTAGLLLGWGWVAACTAVFALWQAESGHPVEPTKEGLEPEPVE